MTPKKIALILTMVTVLFASYAIAGAITYTYDKLNRRTEAHYPDGIEDGNHNSVIDFNETDPCDVDTDGDGIQDGTELGYTLADIGPDTDTMIFQPDLDPLSKTNALAMDTDNDGLYDSEEDTNANGMVDSGEQDPNVADCDYLLHDNTIVAGTARDYITPCAIAAGPTFLIEATADVTFQAGTEITLSDGFEAKAGSEFIAAIAP